jgi:hypothetical protein
MSKKINGWGPYRSLALVTCCAALVFAAAGCKDSEKSAADRKSRQSVDQAGRILQGSKQGLVMTESDLKEAANPKTNLQRLAEQIKARRDQAVNFQEFDEKMNKLTELQQQYQQTKEVQLLQEISVKALEANQWLIDADVTLNAAAAAQKQQRMQNAQKLLQDAITQAKQAKNNAAQIGPNLVQGALQLLQYQAALAKYKRQEVTIRTLQTTLGQMHTEITRQEIFGMYLESQRPDDKVNRLKELVEQRSRGLQDQLTAVERKIADIQTQQQQVQQQYETNQSKASELEKQYLKLTLDAEKLKGDEQYKLLDKAYVLRSGEGEGANRVEGSIYYEAQAELAQSQLDIIGFNLKYEQLRKDLINQSIQQITNALTQLQDPAAIQKLQNDITQTRQKRDAILERMQQNLAGIQEAEQTFQQLREAPVTALEGARQAFTRASQAAQQTRQEFGGAKLARTAGHADQLVDNATEELANFWRRTAQHYQIGASLLHLLSDTTELQAPVRAILDEYKQNAAEAEKIVADLMPDTDV